MLVCPVWAESMCVEAAEREEPNETGLEAGLLGVCPRGAGLGPAVPRLLFSPLICALGTTEPAQGGWTPSGAPQSLASPSLLGFPAGPLLPPVWPPPAPTALSFLPPSGPCCCLILLRTSPFTLVSWEQDRVVTGSRPGSPSGRKEEAGRRQEAMVNQREGGWPCHWMGLWSPPAVPRGDSTPSSGCGDRDSQESA